MKRNFLIKILIVAFCYIALINAQSKFSIGPTIGVNFSTLKIRDATQIGLIAPQSGMYAGIFVNYKFSNLLTVQPEFAFSMKGSSASSNMDGPVTYVMNYFEIPVLVKFYIPISNSGTIKPNFYAGPSFAFNTASRIKNDYDFTLADNYARKFDLGLVFGGGIGILTGKGVLDISLRDDLGMNSIYEPGEPVITNNVFSIIINYGFDF